MYDTLVVESGKRNLPEIKRTLYMMMVRHYGAVLAAVFHSYSDIWLLCSIAEVEHAATTSRCFVSSREMDIQVDQKYLCT
jgi:hypothetical protein